MKRGISLVSLIITIIAIIILASITIFSSFKTIEQAQYVKKENEYRNVCNYVDSISNNLQARTIDVSLTKDTLATTEQINQMYIDNDESEFTAENANLVNSINEAMVDNPEKGYHYITGTQIEYGIPGIDENSDLDKVENNYIINFYYGVVICKISNEKTLVSGIIK